MILTKLADLPCLSSVLRGGGGGYYRGSLTMFTAALSLVCMVALTACVAL